MTMTKGRKEFFHYMFTTALEGGIGYWSVAQAYHWSKLVGDDQPKNRVEDLDGFYAILTPSEEDWGVQEAYVRGYYLIPIDENEPLRVDLAVIERGWNLMLNKVIEATKSEDPEAPFSRQYLRQAVIQWLTDCREGDSDADVADMVVQLGLFGEVVYG